jgi:hypothetical protein
MFQVAEVSPKSTAALALAGVRHFAEYKRRAFSLETATTSSTRLLLVVVVVVVVVGLSIFFGVSDTSSEVNGSSCGGVAQREVDSSTGRSVSLCAM